MVEMNNFHGFFPEGYLRQEFYRKNNPAIEEIIATIDSIIDQDPNFDLETYLKHVKINHHANSKITELWKNGIESFQKYMDEMESSAKARNAMIEPIYLKLLSLGYSEQQLKQ